MASFSYRSRPSGYIMTLTGLLMVCLIISPPVTDGGLIVKRQALESDITVGTPIEGTSTTIPATVTSTSARMVDFQSDPEPLTRAIEFGFNDEGE